MKNTYFYGNVFIPKAFMWKPLFLFFFLFNTSLFFSQEKKQNLALGFSYGIGNEIKNTDYTYTNRYFKGQFYYTFKTTSTFQFEVLLQPEINFATHQLLNLYFVTPHEPDYEAKREAFTKLKDIREYVLNVGLVVRKPITDRFSLYALLSVGPMITDTETERLSKGFAFSDVFGLGFSYKTNKFTLDLRPNIRHTSNAGLQNSNAGFNTYNIEAGVVFPL
ncbi:acyloxyacyl hydrolase [Flavobacterium soli]|uniref:acyloxyacyl hydrolase n=1 Tax=Flavobacterium soli TaxID=344881 RepID=UPI001FE19213|nr:acyloxyacyl hydrolase [Flavobacterium soli]